MSAQDILYASNDPYTFGGLINFEGSKVIISELEAESTNIENLTATEFVIGDAAAEVVEAQTGTFLILQSNTGTVLDLNSNKGNFVGMTSNTGIITNLSMQTGNIDEAYIDQGTISQVILHGAFAPAPSTNKLYSVGADIFWSGAVLGNPIGTVIFKASITTPDGYLRCDGTLYGTALYPLLFADISYTFGGAGLFFRVPNIQGRTVAGLESSTSLLTAQIDGTTIGSTGGSEDFTLAEANMPAHDHSVNITTDSDGSHTHLIANDGTANNPPSSSNHLGTGGTNYDLEGTNSAPDVLETSTAGAHTHNVTGNTGTAGSGTSKAHIQPTIILVPFIRAF